MKRILATTLLVTGFSASAFAQAVAIPSVEMPQNSYETPIEGAPLAPTNVMPEADLSQQKPLMVVRFNQHRVYFDRALETTVRRAETAKPNVTYVVVSALPQPKEGNIRERDAEKGKENQLAVVNSLRTSGIPEGRIRQRIISDTNITSQEVRLYIQ